MISKEKTGRYLRRMVESRPKKIFDQFDNTNAGIGCVMRFLSETGSPVSAGDISNYMKVSTARVAVLLRKMIEKNLIIKKYNPDDARKTMITLSSHGKEVIQKTKNSYIEFFGNVIDRMGEDNFERFIELSELLRDCVNEEYDRRSKTDSIPDADKK